MKTKDRLQRLIDKLFGNMTDLTSDLVSADWHTRDVGFLGNLEGRIGTIEKQIIEINKYLKS